MTNAAGFPLLSLLTWLPLAGGLFIMTVRGEEAVVASNARWAALWTSLIVFVLSLVLWVRFDTGNAGFQFQESLSWLPEFGVGYRMGVDGISVPVRAAVHGADPHLHPGELGGHQGPRARVHAGLPSAGNHDGGHVLRPGLHRVLHVLRGRADPDVPHHRGLGRAAARVCQLQVFPLHAGRLHSHAAGAVGDLVPRGDDGPCGADGDAVAGADAVLAVPGILGLVRGQGADVAGPHLAAGRACGGADGRLRHPGRRAAQDGRLRLPALLRADAAAGGPSSSRR